MTDDLERTFRRINAQARADYATSARLGREAARLYGVGAMRGRVASSAVRAALRGPPQQTALPTPPSGQPMTGPAELLGSAYPRQPQAYVPDQHTQQAIAGYLASKGQHQQFASYAASLPSGYGLGRLVREGFEQEVTTLPRNEVWRLASTSERASNVLIGAGVVGGLLGGFLA